MSAANGHDGGAAKSLTKTKMRRGLLTGAAAFGAAMAAKLAGDVKTAEAVDGQPLVVGQENSTGGTTTLTNAPAPAGIAPGQFRSVTSNATAAIVGQSTGGGTGVRGQSNGGTGVIGVSSVIGVYGETTGTAGPVYGIYGQTTSATTAIIGNATTSGTGVLGVSNGGTALYGSSGSSNGVFGFSTSGNGVFGQSSQRVGVLGISSSSQGVYGLTDRGIGVYGEATVRTSTPGNPAGFAGFFLGRVFIDGDFTATGIKSAALTTNRQELARVYCVEASEAWLEDRGSATLAGGSRRIDVDPEFASTISGEYEVTITGYNAKNPLVVAEKDARGFRVVELNNSASTAGFSFCIWGKRKDIPNTRFAPVENTRKNEKFKPKDGPITPIKHLEVPPVNVGGTAPTPTPRPGVR